MLAFETVATYALVATDTSDTSCAVLARLVLRAIVDFGEFTAKLTGQSFETDADQWANWIAANEKPDPGAMQTANRAVALAQRGPIDSATDFIGQLIRFKNINGHLVLDRDHWGITVQYFVNQHSARYLISMHAMLYQ